MDDISLTKDFGKDAAFSASSDDNSEQHTQSADEDPSAQLVPENLRQPSWLALFKFTDKSHYAVLSAAAFLSVSGGLVIPGMSILLGKIFSAFANYGSGIFDPGQLVREVSRHALTLAILGCGSWLLNGAFFSSWILFGELQAKTAREKLFEGLVNKEMEWYDRRKSGASSLVSKCQTQVRELQMAVSQPLGYTAQAVVTAVASLAVALYHSWSLTLVILAGMPVGMSLLGLLSTRLQPHISRQKEHLSDASRIASRTMTSIETIKAFNGQHHERSVFAKAVDLAAKEYRAQANNNALQIGIIRLLTLSMFVQGFWYGSRLVRTHGAGKAEDVMTTFWSCLMATQALELILPQLLLLEKGRAAGASLYELLVRMERGKIVREMHGGLIPSRCVGEIEIKKVSFAYPSRPSELALDNTSFFIPAKETTYIIGRSGSGKSTLGNLLLNTYHPLSGDIFIDGEPLSVLHPRWLQENISLVQQQSVLFNETLFRNIAFGRTDYENVTREDVQEAIEMADLNETIRQLPLGLETLVGIGGTHLSGGQRQRAALARDRLRNANILILDEATSALDYSTRSRVMDAVHEWRRGKTTVIITHDISEIQSSDFVYILEHGKIVQNGYRKDLEEIPGAFRSFMAASEHNEPRTPRKHRRISLVPELDSDSCNSGNLTPKADTFPYASSFRQQTAQLPTMSTERVIRGRSSATPPLTLKTQGLDLQAVDSSLKLPINRKRRLHRKGPRPKWLETPETPSQKSKRSATLSHNLDQQRRQKNDSLVSILRTVWAALDILPKVLLVCGFVAAAVHATLTPVFSFALAKLLSSILDLRTPASKSFKWSMIILGIAVLDSINSYLMHYLLESSGQSWVDRLRVQALSRILEQPREWFDREKNVVSNITEDVEKNAEEMRNLLGRFVGYASVGILMMILGVGWSFTACWQLTVVGLAIAPVMYTISRGLTWVSDRYEGMCNEAGEATGAIFQETIANITTVRNYALERFFHQNYLGATHEALRVGLRRAIFAGVGFGLSDSAILFATGGNLNPEQAMVSKLMAVTALIFYYGAVLVGSGKAALDDILTVFTLLLFSLASANAIVGMIPQVSNSKDTACRVLRLANLPQNSHENIGSKKMEHKGAIAFRSVSFSYPSRPDVEVIHDLDLTIGVGECVALVGPSGSGKSTLAVLLQRLYTPTAGIITLDYMPLCSLDIFSLRAQMVLVSQTPVLFDCSIRGNIAYGLSPVTQLSEIEAAALMAGIHDFITTLPRGYDTVLGDSGVGLSGGQAQRIAIARAIVRKPRVLILDECTSNLDTESASVIRDTVTRLVKEGRGMTVLIITHSADMMKCAQRVVVMRAGGEVAEVGEFEELVARKGELEKLLDRGYGEEDAFSPGFEVVYQ